MFTFKRKCLYAAIAAALALLPQRGSSFDVLEDGKGGRVYVLSEGEFKAAQAMFAKQRERIEQLENEVDAWRERVDKALRRSTCS